MKTRKCTNCRYFGRPAVCPMYDNRVGPQSSKAIAMEERSKDGHCHAWIPKYKRLNK